MAKFLALKSFEQGVNPILRCGLMLRRHLRLERLDFSGRAKHRTTTSDLCFYGSVRRLHGNDNDKEIATAIMETVFYGDDNCRSDEHFENGDNNETTLLVRGDYGAADGDVRYDNDDDRHYK